MYTTISTCFIHIMTKNGSQKKLFYLFRVWIRARTCPKLWRKHSFKINRIGLVSGIADLHLELYFLRFYGDISGRKTRLKMLKQIVPSLKRIPPLRNDRIISFTSESVWLTVSKKMATCEFNHNSFTRSKPYISSKYIKTNFPRKIDPSLIESHF